MSTIGSNRTRITGMSGFDTETLVSQLMKAESLKLNQLKQKSQLLTWQQEAYRGITTNLKTFQDTFLSFSNISTNFKSDTMFRAMKVSITGKQGAEIKGVSIKSKSGSQNTTTNLEIKSFASKDTYVGNSLNTAIASDKKKVDIEALKEGHKFDITLDGKKTTIELKQSDFEEVDGKQVLKLENLNKRLEEDVFGKDGNIPKVQFTKNASGAIILQTAPGHNITISDNVEKGITSGDLKIDDLAGKKLEFKVNDTLVSVDIKAGDSAEDISKKLNEEFTKNNLSVNASLTDGKLTLSATGKDKDITIEDVNGSMGKIGFSNTGNKINLTTKDSIVESLGFTSGATNANTSSQKLSDVFSSFYSFPANGKAELIINGKKIEFDKDETIDDLVKRVNESGAGVTMKFNKVTNSFRIESNEMGSGNSIDFEGDFAKTALGFDKDNPNSHIEKASDAIVVIDGKQISRASNTFELADGLEVTLDPTVDNVGDTMTIKATPDTESTLTNIKKFIEEYNKLLDTLNGTYMEKREKSSTYDYYEPLTDEQRDAMSEKDVEKWEEKAKTGLLRNDPTVGKIISDLRSWVSEGVDLGDGKKISLYDLGISGTHWTDRGKLTIVDEDKLKKALEERPDDVAALFNKTSDIPYSNKEKRGQRMSEEGLAYRIDDIIQNSIKVTADKDGQRGSLIEKAGAKDSASVTDNALYDALKEQDERIYQMIEKLNSKEDYYYKMFSAMETSMNKYNSQSSWLSQQQFA